LPIPHLTLGDQLEAGALKVVQLDATVWRDCTIDKARKALTGDADEPSYSPTPR